MEKTISETQAQIFVIHRQSLTSQHLALLSWLYSDTLVKTPLHLTNRLLG